MDIKKIHSIKRIFIIDLVKKDITMKRVPKNDLISQVAESCFNAIKHWIEVTLSLQVINE